jgi:aminotransferase
VNTALRSLAPHASRRISEALASIEGAIDLTVGYPSYGPPATFSATVADLAGRAPASGAPRPFDLYPPGRGTLELRTEIALLYEREHGLSVDPEAEVLVTHGAAGALAVAILATTEPGDELLLGDPCYMLYEPLARSLGRQVRRLPTVAAEGFKISAEALAATAGTRSRAVVVNSPANPTGAVYGRDQIGEIVAGATDLGLTVISDEVLDCFSGDSPLSARACARGQGVISVNSLSKRFGMTGWRLGWLLADAVVAEQALKAQTFLSLGVNHLSQIAAAAALDDDAANLEVAEHAAAVRANGEWLAAALAGLDLSFLRPHPPAGGFYLWVEVDREIDPPTGSSHGEEMAARLLEELGIGVVPGIAFGPSGSDFVRLSFAGRRRSLEEAVERISRWA